MDNKYKKKNYFGNFFFQKTKIQQKKNRQNA